MNQLSITFLKFAIIGFSNSILDTLIWKYFSGIFFKNKKILDFLHRLKMNQYSGAQVISFSVSLVSSFFLNSYFTWKVSPLESTNRALLYVVVAVTAWSFTTFFINYLTKEKFLIKFNSIVEKFETRINLNQIAKKFLDYPLLVKVASILISMIINFVGYNYLVFR